MVSPDEQPAKKKKNMGVSLLILKDENSISKVCPKECSSFIDCMALCNVAVNGYVD